MMFDERNRSGREAFILYAIYGTRQHGRFEANPITIVISTDDEKGSSRTFQSCNNANS